MLRLSGSMFWTFVSNMRQLCKRVRYRSNDACQPSHFPSLAELSNEVQVSFLRVRAG